ncbi:MAG: hypothetical protein KDA85_21895, partial [Planctomycetaceae bacterium]|nr:hypothetical protein [Planctomycetaceae bacterium]
WTWAWERFDGLTHPDMAGVNETNRVSVTLTDGRTISGYPDCRQSVRGMLVLFDRDATGPVTSGPFSVDQVCSVVRDE